MFMKINMMSSHTLCLIQPHIINYVSVTVEIAMKMFAVRGLNGKQRFIQILFIFLRSR